MIVGVGRTSGQLAMMPLEALLRSKDSSRHHPPACFIIGPPRSGTTLLYEAMVTRFRFAFIANAAHRFHRTPLAATWLFRRAIRQWHGSFNSRFGHIHGWAAPNEGGWVWLRWLPDGEWTDGAALAPGQIVGPRALTAGLSAVLGAPFLNKNVMHSNRLLAMQRIWPDARYIVVARDAAENARSIIRAERGSRGPAPDADQWWSVRPRLAPDWKRRSVAERAVAQVVGVQRDIAQDAPQVGAGRFHTVDYARLCASPGETMDEIEAFLARTGGAPDKRGDLPGRFGGIPPAPLGEADEAAITRTLAELGAA